jgi:hypothetical protein
MTFVALGKRCNEKACEPPAVAEPREFMLPIAISPSATPDKANVPVDTVLPASVDPVNVDVV